MAPTLSIVTPSFNQGRFLPRCLASIRAQPPGLVEHIVIDGGSTDGSDALLADLGATLAYWQSEPDRGQSDAINLGFGQAHAPFGGWLNADDWYQPGVLERVAGFLTDHPETDLLVCRCHFVAEDGRVIHAPIPPERIDEPSLLSLGSQWFAGRSFAQPEVFFRLSMFREVGGVRIENHHSMDHELWLKFLERGARVRQLDLHVANLSVHTEQKTADRLATTASILAHSREWLDRRGMLWPRHEPEIRAELEKLDGKLLLATRYVRVLDRALAAGASRAAPSERDASAGASVDTNDRSLSPTPKGWQQAVETCLSNAPTGLTEAVVVSASEDAEEMGDIVRKVSPGVAIRTIDPDSLLADPSSARAGGVGTLLIMHRVLSLVAEPSRLMESLLAGVAQRTSVLISAEPEASETHRLYLGRLRTRAIHKVTHSDNLILAPHADPLLLPQLQCDDSPLLHVPHPLGIDPELLFTRLGPRAKLGAVARFGRADNLPVAPFPTLPKLAPRADGRVVDLWQTAIYTV